MIFDPPVWACDSQVPCDLCGAIDGCRLVSGLFLCAECAGKDE